VRIAYAKLVLCEEHYIEYIRTKVKRALERYSLVKRGDRVLLAVSGGKDSATLLDIMASLSKELGFLIAVLHIDLGIDDYSAHLKQAVKKHTESLGVPLIIVDLKQVLGATLPQLAKISKRPICSICGVVKRYIMNAAAVESGATSIATGHNADDMIAYAMKSFLLQDYFTLSKLVPRTETLTGGISRIRPLYEVYERETLLYAILKNLPFYHGECPFAPRDSLDRHFKHLFNQLEEAYPSTKISFLRRLAKQGILLQRLAKNSGNIERVGVCSLCGLIASASKCAFCKITERALGEAAGKKIREYLSSIVKDLWR